MAGCCGSLRPKLDGLKPANCSVEKKKPQLRLRGKVNLTTFHWIWNTVLAQELGTRTNNGDKSDNYDNSNDDSDNDKNNNNNDDDDGINDNNDTKTE